VPRKPTSEHRELRWAEPQCRAGRAARQATEGRILNEPERLDEATAALPLGDVIDFAKERANLPLGVIGVKVWIYKGEVFAPVGKGGKEK